MKEVSANVLGNTGQYKNLDDNYACTVKSYDLTDMGLGEIAANDSNSGSNDLSTVSFLFDAPCLILMCTRQALPCIS